MLASMSSASRRRSHVVGQPPQVAHPPEMGQVHVLGAALHQAPDGLRERRRIELDGRGGRKDERPAGGIQFAVGNAEGVAAEPAAAVFVPDTEVMPRVAGRIEELQRALADLQAAAVLHDDHAVFRHRQQRAVLFFVLFVAVYGPGAGLQPRRVDHVPGAARVHDQRRVGQAPHQAARAARMVQVDMGHDDVAYLLHAPPALRDDRQDALAAVIVAGLDHGQRRIGLQQVTGGHARPDHAAVDGQYAACVFQRRHALTHGHAAKPTQ
ncbi:MAG: hypothetical protein MUE63_02850 [Xanthomonadales bacterium]|nr:hypothetical protein [Xanthomonadales bacterium]